MISFRTFAGAATLALAVTAGSAELTVAEEVRPDWVWQRSNGEWSTKEEIACSDYLGGFYM